MNRRLIGLLAALVLAGIATFFLVMFVTSADERARSGEELAEVFVAQGDIAAGTSANEAISQGLIDQDEVPVRAVPSGAVAGLEQIAGQRADGAIFAGEIIVAGRFSETVTEASGLAEIPEGLEAITVEGNVVSGLAGFVQVGDQVSVVGTAEVPAGAPGFGEGGEVDDTPEGEVLPRSEYIAKNAIVLSVGQRVVPTGGQDDDTPGGAEAQVQQSNERYIFTLAVTSSEVEKLVFASTQGTLWFTLLPEDQETAETPGRSRNNSFG